MKTTLFTALLVLFCLVCPKWTEAQIDINHYISCSGSADGELTVDPNFGSGPYTYLWSTGDVTQTITNLNAGIYDVTVTDALLTTTVYTETLFDPPPLIITFVSQTNVLCKGFSTGFIDVTVAGGTGTYWYSWSNGAITEDISNVPAGNYTLIATDANGCTATANYIITEPALPLQVTLTATTVSCFNGNNGTATANPVGGTGVYSYNWSTGAITANIVNRPAGNYSVTVTDANGCTTTNSITITQPATPVQVFSSFTNVSCFGVNDGSAIVVGTGGSGALSYLWSNAAVTSTIVNLTAGPYSVTVTDANGCNVVTNFVIIEPALPVQTLITSTDVTCFGGNNGSATITGTGIAPISYLWSTGEIALTIMNLTAGNYSVTVTDANSCSAIDNVIINQPAPISIVPAITSSACDGQNNGAITLVIAGGTPAYTFAWQEVNFDSTYTTQNLLNVRGGTYALMITDANSCVYLDTLIIPNTVTVPVNISPTFYVCNGDQGSVSINALLADSAYYFMYSWSSLYNTGSFTTNDSVFTSSTSFIAGSYTIIVTDVQTDCASYYDFTINQSATPLVVVPIVQHNTCYADAAGSITLQVTGGDPLPAYQCNWTGPNGYTSTAFSIGGLPVGDYTYTVDDDGACSLTGTIRILPLMPLQGYVTSENVLCNGDNNGQVEAFYSGGTGPLSYLWSNGATTPYINNLVIGTYTLTVTDSVGCFIISSATIIQPPAIAIVLDSLNNVSCYGGTDGGIWLTTSGGTDVLEYIWLHDGILFNQITEDITNIPAGIYQITAMDSIGCFTTTTFTVTQPAPTIFKDSVNVINCNNGSTGSWYINIWGPNPPYIAIFSTGDTISTDTIPVPFISGLSAGSYSVTIISSIGCDTTFTLVLQQPLPITVGVVNIVPVICYGDSTGSIILDAVHGGTSPYTFMWDNGMTTNPIVNVPANMYNVTITDAKGCNIYETYEVEEPYEWIKFFPQVTNTTCQQAEDGQVVLNTEDIYWSPFVNTFYLYDSLGVLVDSVSPGQAIGNLPSGFYQGILINQYGCTARNSLYIDKGPGDCIIIPNLVTINGDGFNDVFKVQGGCEYQTFLVKIFTDQGEQVFESVDCNFIWDPRDNKATANSVYYYYIKVTENAKLYEFKSSINIQK